MKRIAISQSNYIPWKGYFDLINMVDIFVLYDDMQYTKRDWRNRNKIKTPQGPKWLSIPVKAKGKYFQKINETEVVDVGWAQKHWTMLEQNYRTAPYFKETSEWLKPIYMDVNSTKLSDINEQFIRSICGKLEISTTILDSSQFELESGKSEKLIGIAETLNASHYLSGPAAKGYLDEGLFNEHGIEVEWVDYSGYSEYPQLFGEFEHSVSIVDILFNCGPDAPNYMRLG